MSLNHRRLMHVPSEVDVVALKANLKLYADKTIARIMQALTGAADGCYTSIEDDKGTFRLSHPVFIFQGKIFASYLTHDDEVGYVQELESGEWLKRRKISVREKKEDSAVLFNEFDRIIKHGVAIGELAQQGNQHIQFFKAREQKAKPPQKPRNMLMLHPGMMIPQESYQKKEKRPEGDYIVFTKITPGMSFAKFMVQRHKWPAALKLNMSIMMVSLVAEMQAASRMHVNLDVDSVIFSLQKKLEKMIRLQGFGLCAAADEAVKQLPAADVAIFANHQPAPEWLANNAVLGRFLQALWRDAELPQPLHAALQGLMTALLSKERVDLAKAAVMLSELKWQRLLPFNETLIPVYLLKVSDCREIMNRGHLEFKAFCNSLAAHYVSVRLFDCTNDNAPASQLELLKMKEALERANLIVSDKYYVGTRQQARHFIKAKTQRQAVEGMRFVFSTAESVMIQYEFDAVEEGGYEPADTRLELGENETPTDSQTALDDFSNDADDEDSGDVLDAMLDAASEMTTRFANCCLRVFRPSSHAQHSLDAATDGPLQLHTDTAWESSKRLV